MQNLFNAMFMLYLQELDLGDVKFDGTACYDKDPTWE